MPNKYLDSVGLAEYTSLVKTALDDKADLDSPALTGTPTAPTPTAGDDSTKIATTEFVQDAIDAEETRADGAYLPLTGGSVTGNLTVSGSITGNLTGNATNDGNGNPIASTYLPLSGGTMTGAITTSAIDFIVKANNTSHLAIMGGTAYGSSASIILAGGDESSQTGLFQLRAQNGTSYKDLLGKPDGTLTWGGTAISLNGHTHSYLPLSGGTMTGEIKRNGVIVSNTVDTSYNRIYGGSTVDNGSVLTLWGKSHSSNAGQFSLKADNGSSEVILYGKPNGDLTWGGLDISPQKLSTVTYDDKNIANNTRTSLGTFSLTKGTWIIVASASFANNATGYRYLGISTTATGNQLSRYHSVSYAAASGLATHIIFTTIHFVTETTTFYITVHQTSGSTLATSNNGVRLFRLSHNA